MANPTAQAHKEKGNAAFKAGDYPTAIGHYTSAILADDPDPHRKDLTFPLNRAAAYLKLAKYADTERDCNSVLAISAPKTNVKALFRRGQARVGLGKLSEAQQDFKDVLSQEPSNASASDELKAVNDLIIQKGKKAQKSKALPVSVSPPSTTSTPDVKRRRVPIRIVGDASTSDSTSATKRSLNNDQRGSSSSSMKYDDDDDALQPISSRSLRPTSTALDQNKMDITVNVPSTSSSSSTQAQAQAEVKPKPKPQPHLHFTTKTTPDPNPEPSTNSNSFKEAKESRDRKQEKGQGRVGGGIFRASGESRYSYRDLGSGGGVGGVGNGNGKDEREELDTEHEQPQPSIKPQPQTTPHPTLQPTPKTAPKIKTLFDFSRTWYALRTPWERWAFLDTIPPAQFPGLCKTSLEPSLLVSILDVFLAILTSTATPTAKDNPNNSGDLRTKVRAYMDDFTSIPRFSTLVLFLSGPERELAREVWMALGVDRPEGVWKSVGGK